MSAAFRGHFGAMIPDKVVDRNGVEIKPFCQVIVYQEESTRIATVTAIFPDNPTVGEPGHWIDVSFGDGLSEGMPSYICEIISKETSMSSHETELTEEQLTEEQLTEEQLTEEQLAERAIDLQVEINKSSKELDGIKARLRQFADGKTKSITISGKGSVEIKKPVIGEKSTELTLNTEQLLQNRDLKDKLLSRKIVVEEITYSLDKDVLNKNTDLRNKMISKGLISESVVTGKSSIAAVTIKPNK